MNAGRGAPKRFAVIGDPVAHSKSPKMHGAAYAALGLPHTYEAVRVAPADVESAVAALRNGTFDGLNVTVPHKESVLRFVDTVCDSAIGVGAANTLVRTSAGRVEAHNTDARALADELEATRSSIAAPPVRGTSQRGLVFGAGGAARAAIVALVRHVGIGFVDVRSRRFADAELAASFVAEMKHLHGDAIGWTVGDLSMPVSAFTTIVVQATSSGMHGASDGTAVAHAVPWSSLGPSAIALDVVYSPPQTPFLEAALSSNVRCANGMGMLARQGARAFELWLGIAPPFETMLRALA